MANIPFHIWQGLEVLHKTKVKVKQIACGAYHCLFLATTGRAYSCGLNKFGQLGRAVGSGSNAIVNIGVIPQLSDIAHIYCGSHHNFFVKSTGEIFSCGNNEFNQLNRIVVSGSETSINLGQNSSIPGLVKIACGHWHTLFLNSDGEALSCGYNNFGQLGRAAPNGSLAEVFLSNIVDIACGGHHSFLLTLDGQVYSCGTNSSGQTGRTGSGTATSVNLAIINSLSDIVKISASFSHSLFLNSAGEVYACGYNAY
jgi:E3 ubiquitin-protein ligase HERC3